MVNTVFRRVNLSRRKLKKICERVNFERETCERRKKKRKKEGRKEQL